MGFCPSKTRYVFRETGGVVLDEMPGRDFHPLRGRCAVLWHIVGVFGAFCYSFVTRAVFHPSGGRRDGCSGGARRRPQTDALPDGGGRLHRKAAPRPGGSSAALAEPLVPEAGDPPRREARGLHRDDAQLGMKEVKSERPRVLLQGVNNPSRARADTFPRVHVLGCRSISLYIHISKF